MPRQIGSFDRRLPTTTVISLHRRSKTKHGCSKHILFGASGSVRASHCRWFCMVATEDSTYPTLRLYRVSCGSLGLLRELWWALRPSWALLPLALLKKLVFFSRAKGKNWTKVVKGLSRGCLRPVRTVKGLSEGCQSCQRVVKAIGGL